MNCISLASLCEQVQNFHFGGGANVIYNPYNPNMMNPGMPNTVAPANAATYPNAAQPAMNYDANQMMMNQQNYTQVVPQTTSVYPAATTPVAQTAPVYPAAPVNQMPFGAYPAYPGYVTPAPTFSNGSTVCVPVAMPVATPAQVAMPQQQSTKVTTPIAETKSTTATHKKTTYVEAYVQPVESEVPLMQPTVQKTTKKTDTYPASGDIVYVEQQPVKNSTMQDYNLYLMEKEYYDDMEEPTYYKKTTVSRDPRQDAPLTCENLPLATTYVKAQTYTGHDNPNQTLQQGTTFNALYDVYTPQKVGTPTIFRLKGGRR